MNNMLVKILFAFICDSSLLLCFILYIIHAEYQVLQFDPKMRVQMRVPIFVLSRNDLFYSYIVNIAA